MSPLKLLKLSESAPYGPAGEGEVARVRETARCEEHGEKRVPELDGLRGIAILMVLLFHFSDAFEGLTPPFRQLRAVFVPGWTGVDLFFVLSGFLISGILLNTKNSPGYFRDFYIKRVLRIFPVYYLALFISLTVSSLADPSFHRRTSTVLAYVFHGANWLSIQGREIPVINHFWSLAVEEQFYLCWPLAVYLLTRRGLAWFCAALIAAAPVLRYLILAGYLGGVDTEARVRMAFVLTPARADTLAIGALAAIAVSNGRFRAWMRNYGGYALALSAAVLACWFALRHSRIFDGTLPRAIITSFIGVTYGLTLLRVIISRPPSNRFLRSRTLRLAGKYSYAAYVFHYPLMLGVMGMLGPLMRNAWVAVSYLLGGIGMSFAVAILSWNLVEKKMLALKERFVLRESAKRANC